MKTTAVFLDRDGTIIEDAEYVRDPAEVRLLPGAAEAIRHFGEMGYLAVVISNQSGIARGLFDEDALARVHRRLEQLLAEQDARLDGAYYCPYLSGQEAIVETYRKDSELRKPKPGMILQAAEELSVDLSRSWMIGNSMRDVQAGAAAGCRTILIEDPDRVDGDLPDGTPIVRTLLDAVAVVEASDPKRRAPLKPKPPSRSPTRPEERVTSSSETVRLLRKIHDRIESFERQRRQHDFSVLRLFGALLQMFAVATGVWGALALLNDQHDAATARLVFACFLQLAALSAFAIDRFR